MALSPPRRGGVQLLDAIPWLAVAFALAVSIALLSPFDSTVLVVGGALAVVAVLRPTAGVAFLLVAVPFGEVVPDLQWSVGALVAGPGEVLVGLVSVGWLAGTLARFRRLEVGPLFWPIAAFFGAQLLSASFAEQAAPALKELLRTVQLLLAYLIAANLLRGDGERRLVLGALLTAGLAQSLVGIYQFATGTGPDGYRIGQFLRAYGSFGQPNPYAGYLELVVPLALALVVLWRPSGRGWLWWLALATTLAGFLAIVVSLSRGAWLGLGIGILVGAAVAVRRSWLVLAGGIALGGLGMAAAGAGLLPGAIGDRLVQAAGYFRIFDARGVIPTPETFAVVERMAHWQAGWEMLLDYPIVGVGPGHYVIAYHRYAILPQWSDPLGHAHNIYVNVAAESGVIGLLTYLTMVGAWLVVAVAWARRLSVSEPGSLRRAVAVGILGCIVAHSAHSLFDNLYVHLLNVQVGLLIGLMVSTARASIEAEYVLK